MTTLRTPAQLFIAQTKLFQRHCAKHIRIADATLREFDDFLCDKSRGWVAIFKCRAPHAATKAADMTSMTSSSKA